MSRQPKPRTIKKYTPKVRKLLKLESERNKNYKASDELFAELLERLRLTDRVPTGDGRFFQLKDNFLDKEGKPKNKAYRAHGISRFEYEIVDA